MRGYVLRRLAALVPTALGVSLLIFGLMHLIPSTVVDQMIGAEARVGDEARQAMRAFFGLDRPLHVQYLGARPERGKGLPASMGTEVG